MRGTFVFGSRGRVAVLLCAVLGAALVIAACGSSSSSSSSTSGSSSNAASTNSGKHLKLAYLSFAVANSYDAPMLAAAQAVAASNNASLTVFDANNDPNKQFSQLQNAITAGGYDGVITQPIESTNLIPLVTQAIQNKIRVSNIDHFLGPKLDTFEKQVPGQAVNVTFVPTDIGTKLGNSDQGIEGATQAVGKKKVILVGYGGAAAAQQGVSSGAWYGDVAQNPATEGRLGTQQLIDAIRKGTSPAAVNALTFLPADGVMTKANASEFHPEWPG